jgi:hypothetical protein
VSGDDDQLRIVLDQLARLSGQPPPPMITPDQLASGRAMISQLLRALGAAANGGDPADTAAAAAGYTEREAKVGSALTKFPANEEESAAKLGGVGSQNEMAQMVQQVPQIASGLASGIAGAISGALQPLTQIPQQAAQIGQQAMQAGLGALQHGGGGAAEGTAIPADLLGAGGEAAELGGGGGGADGAGGLGTTTPTAMLGPLPTPSAGTVPASSHVASTVPPAAPEPAPAARGGMGAMPMMPGALGAAGTGSDGKPDTKRIVAPTVKNGAPVQGRITVPPSLPEVVKRVEGKPVASRRIVLPDDEVGSTR